MCRRFAILLFFFLVTGLAAYGEVTVIVVSLGNPQDPGLSHVISSSAAVQLQQAGLAASSGTAAGGATAGAGAKPNAAAFALFISYSRKGGQLALELSFRDTHTGKTISAFGKTVPFDLNLDTSVSQLVKALIARPEVVDAIKRAEQAAQAQVAKAAPTPAPSGGALPVETIPPRTAPAAAAGARWRFVADLHGAPMILVGTASNYFRYGADVSVFTALRLPPQKLSVETGLQVSASQLFSVFGSSDGRVYALSAGPEVRIGNAPGSPAHIGLTASGGASVILAQPAGAGFLAKTDPYVGAGINATMKIFRSVTLGVEIGSRVIFEERYPIVAVLPALAVGFSP